MKKVLRMMALVAAVASAAFMTGCGDDNNNNNNNNNTVNAPAVAALQGKTFTFGNGDSLLLSPAGSTYTYTPHGGLAETGTYQYAPSGTTATIVTVTDTTGAQTTYNLSFTGAANNQYAGTITRTPQGGNPSASTTFLTSGTNNNGGGGGNTNTNTTTIIAPSTITGKNYLVNGGTNGTVTISFPSGSTYTVAAGGAAIETGSYTYTPSTTTNTAVIQLNPTTAGETPNTVTLTYTSVTANAESGTVSESDGVSGTFTQTASNGINQGGGGNVTAPTALHSVNVVLTGGPFAPANYSIILSGNGQSGTFEITNGSIGTGTYTYTANGATAVLILHYQTPTAGDNDTLNMTFTSTTAGTFTGSTLAQPDPVRNDVTGTFSNAQ